MKNKIKELLKEVEEFTAEKKEQIEEFRISLLGSKGKLKTLFSDFKNVPNDQKKEIGQLMNTLKENAQHKIDELTIKLSSSETSSTDQSDLSRTATPIKLGSKHPITIVRNEIIDIFSRIGFT